MFKLKTIHALIWVWVFYQLHLYMEYIYGNQLTVDRKIQDSNDHANIHLRDISRLPIIMNVHVSVQFLFTKCFHLVPVTLTVFSSSAAVNCFL